MARLTPEGWAQVALLMVGSYGARVSEVGVQALYAMLMQDFPDVSLEEARDAVMGHVRESVHPPTYAEIRGRVETVRRDQRNAAVHSRRLALEPDYRESFEKQRALATGDVETYLSIGDGGWDGGGELAAVEARIRSIEERPERGAFLEALLVSLRTRRDALSGARSQDDLFAEHRRGIASKAVEDDARAGE